MQARLKASSLKWRSDASVPGVLPNWADASHAWWFSQRATDAVLRARLIVSENATILPVRRDDLVKQWKRCYKTWRNSRAQTPAFEVSFQAAKSSPIRTHPRCNYFSDCRLTVCRRPVG